ncbi:MAG TPA: TonB-dependent receptor plug domain-containing protein, partial [Bacteroidales bacterium]|nr:TonB-dependent receptor plug domain-containing protein [Bacteroidales bacterium]
VNIVVSCIGFRTKSSEITLQEGEQKELDFVLQTEVREFDEVSVSARQERATTLRTIDIKSMNMMPTANGSVESIIKTLPGVSSNNELSSQYSVRGGNYDENLVYVNDIEIYRPFLVRSGQQEGLSFINSDLISSIRFSAGGFAARFGDKMSSVLDITYRTPEKFAGSVSMSLLGGSAHLEGISKNRRLTFLGGFRYKTTAYLLKSLETKGEYKPRFSDFQGLLTYKLSDKLDLSVLGNVAVNQYRFIPETRTTEFGTSKQPYNLVIYFDGNETDRFDTYFGATSLTYKPNRNLRLKFIGSAFSTIEYERFDILGQYLLNELDNTVGSDTYGDSILNIGIGSFLNHARNYLNAYVYSASHIGEYNGLRHKVKWGTKFEYDRIFDQLSEWQFIDSAGFSIPNNGDSTRVFDLIKANNHLNSTRLSAFLQDTWGFRGNRNEYYITAGVRGTYLWLNHQFLFSPRASFSVKPDWERDIMFHFSSGIYYQPPFYKEMRNPSGRINRDLRAQKSIHLVLGGDYIFSAWDRPFKFTSELFYKYLDDLVPYKIDNVRIRYAGQNLAKGYATGIDFKLNGDFVKGAESWVSLSFLRTREDIKNDSYIETNDQGITQVVYPGYYPRPTDQLMNFGLYFQDYFPNNPDIKVHLNFLYGSRLPYSSPDKNRYDQVFRLPPYRRVDIGFSKVLKKASTPLKPGNPFRYFNDIWISGEIFNLFGINNTVSYLWVQTVSNQDNQTGVFGVPNYLTSRLFNVKLMAKF